MNIGLDARISRQMQGITSEQQSTQQRHRETELPSFGVVKKKGFLLLLLCFFFVCRLVKRNLVFGCYFSHFHPPEGIPS